MDMVGIYKCHPGTRPISIENVCNLMHGYDRDFKGMVSRPDFTCQLAFMLYKYVSHSLLKITVIYSMCR